MRNYLKLYKKYWSINLKSVMLYDVDYILGIIAMIIKCAVNFSMVLLLYYIVDDIVGWTKNEMIFLYGISSISYALWHCFFIDMITIPTYIQSGEFDKFMIKPVDPLFQIMMESFDEDGWGELLFGIAVLIISIVRLEIHSITIFLIPLFCIAGCLIFASLSILCSAAAFFTTGNIDLTDNVMDFKEFAKYPLTIFGTGFRIVFTCVIPIAFAGYYPSLLYLSETIGKNGYICFWAFPIAILFFIISWKFWHFALRRYSSSGV